jgi:hypothetical protein
MSGFDRLRNLSEIDTPREVNENQEGLSEVDHKITCYYDKYLEGDKAQNFVFKSIEEKETERKADLRNCPIEGNGGHWDGERGESKWIPERDQIPQKYNPDGKTWGEILDEHNISGIEFRDGEPDFSEVTKQTVEIDDFSDDRTDNFDQADEALAERWALSPEEAADWRKVNKYTWHECRDCETMQLVPSEVHNNITHRGGVSRAKEGAV